jgi:hypothetical protein
VTRQCFITSTPTPPRPQRGARGATFSPGRFRHRGTFSLNVEGGPSPRRAHGEGRAMGAEAVPLKLPEGPSSLLKWETPTVPMCTR